MDKDLRKDIHRAFEKEYYEHARSGQRGVLKSVENAKSFFMKTLNHQSAFLSVITFANAAIVGTALAMPSVGAVVFGPTVAIITFGISVTSTALLWASHISAVRKARRQMDEDIDSGKLL